MKPGVPISLAALVAVVVFGIAFYENDMMATAVAPSQQSQGATTQTTSQQTSASSSTPGATSYTLSQVARHDSRSSCWSAINGKVYDLTNWINQHPGGPDRILSICGIDGSSAFNAQHGGNQQVESVLQQFYIGILAQ